MSCIQEELMKQDKEDIDWGKLRLIVAKIKMDFGVTDGGKIKWNLDLAKNFIHEQRQMAEPASPYASKENRGDSNEGIKESQNRDSNSACSNYNPNASHISNNKPTLSESNPPPLTKSDSSKRKREMPEWMMRSVPKDNSKKMKANSLFK